MQGSGLLVRDGREIYIGLNSGHWEETRTNRRVYITSEGWFYYDDRKTPAQYIESIQLVDAQFGLRPKPENVPYFDVAAPPEFAKGTLLYAPALANQTPYEGVFRVADRGGAFPVGEPRFDLFTGLGTSTAIQWWGVPGRTNTDVYVLVVDMGEYDGKR
jgi:hypothetical protein